MIPEVFLIAALSMPAVSHVYGDTLVCEEVSFSRLMLNTQRNVLIIGGDPSHLNVFRHYGMKAFGALVTDGFPPTPFHAISELGKLPFLPASFDNVWFSEPNRVYRDDGYKWLVDAIRLVAEGHFFFYRDLDWPMWDAWLKSRNFERLPFRLGDYVIYQKRYYGDTKGRGYDSQRHWKHRHVITAA